MLGPEVILLGRGERHLASGEPLDTPSPTEQQPLPVTDGRQGTASALASSEAEKDRAFSTDAGEVERVSVSTPMLSSVAGDSDDESRSRRRQEVHLVHLTVGSATCRSHGSNTVVSTPSSVTTHTRAPSTVYSLYTSPALRAKVATFIWPSQSRSTSRHV
jgi:hypothetical protein